MGAKFLTLNGQNIDGKRILMREDFNVPIVNGEVQNDLRIRAALPGIKQALAANGQVILMSHLGRPVAGMPQKEYSLRPVAKCLEKLLSMPVKFIEDWFAPNAILATDKLVLLENVRFLKGEVENDPVLSQQMAKLGDVFVMDAFGSAHRAHASTVGITDYVPLVVAGPLLAAEIQALDRIMQNPLHPIIAVIGGSKVSTKLDVLQSLILKTDTLIIGGGMANTLLAAQGHDVGASLYEPNLIPTAQKLLQLASANKCKILLPTDVVIQDGSNKQLSEIQASDKIMDIGSDTIQVFSDAISLGATIIWNGPLGVFEDSRYAAGTEAVAVAIAQSKAFSIAGGGDTLAAVEQFNLNNKISYISTGGGAFLEYIEGKTLPAIQALSGAGK